MQERTMRHSTTPASIDFEPPAPTHDELTSVPVTVHAGRRLRGFIIAINERGLLAALPHGVSAEKMVEVAFEMPDGDRTLRVVGEVAWSNFYVDSDGIGFSGVGIEFLGIGAEGRDYLEDFVAANDGERLWDSGELDVLS